MQNFVSFEDFKKNPNLINSNQKPVIKTTEIKTQPMANDSFAKIETEIDKAKKQNGLIEKLADKIKSVLNFGASSKTLDSVLEKAKTGEITEEQANAEIKKYRSSQENTAQAVGDVVSGASSLAAFFGIKQGIEKTVAKFLLVNNSKEDVVENMKYMQKNLKDGTLFKKFSKFITNFTQKHLDKRYSAIGAGVVAAGLIGGIIKNTLLKLNRIGTKQYKADINKETMSKEEIKLAKRKIKKERKNANRRNFYSGMINGLAAPVVSVLGAIGAPIYLGINSLTRYFIGNREDKGNKSINGYVENLKASPITHIASAAALAIPAIKKGHFNKVFEKNLDTVVKKLQNAHLTEATSCKSSYEQLEEILFGSRSIKGIIENPGLSVSEQIQKLSEENIFAVKFMQINPSDNPLANALRTDCPPTRTIKQAQAIITETFGDKYRIDRCVGVGTVAETYLVKTTDGQEYCIKMLKDGITAEKITADKQRFIAIIQEMDDKTAEEKQFLIDNIENIANGILAEVDFNNEMKAAQELAKVTKKAKMVQPVEVKNNLYVMQKANGVSLSDFVNYSSWRWKFLEYETGELRPRSDFEKAIERAEQRVRDEVKSARNCSGKTYPYTELGEYEFINGEIRQKTTTINSHEEYVKFIEAKYQKRLSEAQEDLRNYDKFIELQKLGIGELSEEQAQKMLEAYQDILIEQFSEVNKGGKIIHGDIHPGNIFIDIEALKADKKDFFTLIDTGNTIQQNQEMAMRFLNLTHYIQNADYENIADFVLEGAKLPQGLDKATARAKIIEELKKAFFDDKTHTGIITNDNILSLTDNIMQKLNIIPSDTQGNLMKAKTSASRSMEDFTITYVAALERQLEKKLEGKDIGVGTILTEGIKMSGKMGKVNARRPIMQKIQERRNLALLSPSDRAKLKRSKSTPKKNSEEFLMYQLKQHKKSAQEVLEELMSKIRSIQGNIDNKLAEFIRANGHSPIGMSKEKMFETLTKQQKEAIKESTEYWQKLINKLPESERSEQQQELNKILKLLEKASE